MHQESSSNDTTNTIPTAATAATTSWRIVLILWISVGILIVLGAFAFKHTEDDNSKDTAAKVLTYLQNFEGMYMFCLDIMYLQLYDRGGTWEWVGSMREWGSALGE